MSRKKVSQWIEDNALLGNTEFKEDKVDVDQTSLDHELDQAFLDEKISNDQEYFQVELEIKKEEPDIKLESVSNHGHGDVRQQFNNESAKVNDNITISVFGVQEIKFTVKKKKTLSLPMRLYSRRLGYPLAAFRFVYDGVRVNEEDTPESLEMANGDIIEVYKNQLGG
eukprot:GFUD01017414.1.p1 GENE.GFUD01017414.1~~GFUD01017414.1.p1  ORF type:complete len:168 (+),score=58.68 GFUD01017414.1:79-582(+)